MSFGVSAQRRDYPIRPPADPAAIERGKALYGVNCQFCHGADARGGDSGPNLLRSGTRAQRSERRADRAGGARRPSAAMPKFTLTDDQISDIAAFIHSFRVAGYDESRVKPPSIVVGDAKAGETYFNAKCALVPFGDRRSEEASREDRRSAAAAADVADAGQRRAAAAGRRRCRSRRPPSR